MNAASPLGEPVVDRAGLPLFNHDNALGMANRSNPPTKFCRIPRVLANLSGPSKQLIGSLIVLMGLTLAIVIVAGP